MPFKKINEIENNNYSIGINIQFIYRLCGIYALFMHQTTNYDLLETGLSLGGDRSFASGTRVSRSVEARIQLGRDLRPANQKNVCRKSKKKAALFESVFSLFFL